MPDELPAEEAIWLPNLFDRQLEIFNCNCKALLVCGPRLSGKTLGALARLVRHLWETPGARVAMFARTLKNAKDGGIWDDLNKIVLPEWIDANIGMRYTTMDATKTPGPKVSGQTRTPYLRVTNMYGGESEVHLFSLDVESEIEAKVKSQRFSMFYFSELSNFRDRKVLSTTLEQLRMPHLRDDQHMWIADTNPSEEGEESWIFKAFYIEPHQPYEEYLELCQSQNSEVVPRPRFEYEAYQKQFEVIEIRPEENPFISLQRIAELKANNEHDPGLYARNILGKWTYGDGDKSRHFRGIFSRAIHVIGSIEDANEDNWEILLPSEGCNELLLGWDPGDVNHGVAILEKRDTTVKPVFYMLDEVEIIGEQVGIEELTQMVMEKVEALDFHCGKRLVTARCYSDRSSMDKWSAVAQTYPYLEVLAASDDRFFLQGVAKKHHSVKVRVNLMKRLLYEKRFFVSAHCVRTIAMLDNIKKGKKSVLLETDPHKHIFDAITYALLPECAEDLEDQIADQIGKRKVPLNVQVRLG